MELEKIKKIVEEIGLKVGKNLIVYKNDKEVGKIYRLEGTDQYGMDVNFQKGNIIDCNSNINLEKLIENGDTIRLDENCNAPGKLAVVDEVKRWGVICYIEHPTDKDKRAYFRMKYGSFKLVSSEKKIV